MQAYNFNFSTEACTLYTIRVDVRNHPDRWRTLRVKMNDWEYLTSPEITSVIEYLASDSALNFCCAQNSEGFLITYNDLLEQMEAHNDTVVQTC